MNCPIIRHDGYARAQQIIQQAAKHGFPLTPEEGSNFHRMPADFLIGQGRVLRAHYANFVMDHMPFAEICLAKAIGLQI